MSELNRCNQCNGSKSVLALGNMVKKCPKCNGIGYVERVNISKSIIDKNAKNKLQLEKVTPNVV